MVIVFTIMVHPQLCGSLDILLCFCTHLICMVCGKHGCFTVSKKGKPYTGRHRHTVIQLLVWGAETIIYWFHESKTEKFSHFPAISMIASSNGLCESNMKLCSCHSIHKSFGIKGSIRLNVTLFMVWQVLVQVLDIIVVLGETLGEVLCYPNLLY